MERNILLKLCEVKLGWNADISDVNIRVSLLGHVVNLNLNEEALFKKIVLCPDLPFHFLVQAKNLAIASFTTSLSSLCSTFVSEFSKNFELNVAESVLKLLGFQEVPSRKLSLKLSGIISSSVNYAQPAETPPVNKPGIIKDIEKCENNEYEEKTANSPGNNTLNKQDTDILEYSNDSVEKIKEGEEVKEATNFEQVLSLDKLKISVPASIPSPKVQNSPEEFINYPQNSCDFNENTINPHSISLNLSKDSIKSICPYIQSIKRCEFLELFTESTLKALKADLGSAFARFSAAAPGKGDKSPIKESRPASRSKKAGNQSLNQSMKSECSEISFISTLKCDDTSIEIPSSLEITAVQNLSISNPELLKCCIVSLLSKLTQYEIENEEIPVTAEFISKQDLGISHLENELMKNRDYHIESARATEEMIKDIKQRISAKKEVIEDQAAMRRNIEQELDQMKQKIKEKKEENFTLKSNSVYFEKLGVVKALQSSIQDKESARLKLEQDFASYCRAFQYDSEKSSSEQFRLIDSKQALLASLKSNTIAESVLLKSIAFYTKENQRLSEFSDLSSLTSDLLDSISSSSITLQEATSALSDLFLGLASQRLSESDSSNTRLSKLLSTTASYQQSLSHLSEASSSSLTLLHSLQAEINSRSLSCQNLEELLEKISDIDSDLHPLQSEILHARETEDQSINELCFFSDFLFSFSQGCLRQHRLIHQLQKIDEGKDCDIQVLRETISFMKLKNPVYQHVKGDHIDKALGDYLNARNSVLPLPFIREVAGIYYYGSKKIAISVERGKLTVRIGGGYMFIEDFIEKYTQQELEKYEKRKLEISPRTKKLMAKWVGGILGSIATPKEKMKEIVMASVSEHKFTQAYVIREFGNHSTPSHENSPQTKELEIIRPDTPVIGDDD